VPHPRWSTQDFNLRGPPNATAPHTEDRTSNSDDHAARKDWQDTGAISVGRRTMSMTTASPIVMPHSVLSTVSDHCIPAIRGKRRLPRPHSCVPSLLVTIKGGGGLPLDGTLRRTQTRSIITYTPASLFATFSPSSSRDLEAFLPLSPCLYPYYKHIGCKIIQCPRTPPLLDVRPRGRNQDKPCVTMLSLASSSGTRKHAAFTSWDPGPRVGTPTAIVLANKIVGTLRQSKP